MSQDWKALHPNVKRFFSTCKSCSRNCGSKIGKRFFKVRILLRRLEEQDCKYFSTKALTQCVSAFACAGRQNFSMCKSCFTQM